MIEENSNYQIWSGADEEDEETLSLADLWSMVWDYKWWYALCLAIAVFFAAFYIYKTPSTFSRSEKIIIDEDAQASAMKDLMAFTNTSSRRYSSNVDNEIEAFASPDLMQDVVVRLGLETSYYENQFLRTRELYKKTPFELTLLGDNPKSGFSFLVSKSSEGFTLSDFVLEGNELGGDKIKGAFGDSLVTPVGAIKLSPTIHFDEWAKDITVSWVNPKSRAKGYCANLSVGLSSKQSSVILLSMEDTHPSRAELVLSTLLDIYDEQWINNKTKAARNTTEFINDRLVVIENELGGIETELKEYKQSNNLTDVSSAANSYLQQSSQYSAKGFEAENQLSIAKYIKEYLNDPEHARSLIPANSGLSSSNVESQISEYNSMLLKRDGLLLSATESNPLILDLNQSLDAMRSAINRSVDNLIATLKLQVDKINAEENTIRNKISSASSQEMTLLSIERQQKVKENLYIFLLQKREENEITSLMTVSATRLIMQPTGSSSPVGPNKKMILLIALVLGFGLPFAFIYISKLIDTTIKNKADLTKLTAPFLAEIPQMGITGNYWQRLRADRFDDSKCNIVVQGGKRDMRNEAFRVLRTNLEMMTSSDSGCHVLMVTSFNPNAGKTFTIQNMAASMAVKGSKTLLLDLDLRKATLSKALNMNNTGTAAYLNGRSSSIVDSIQHVSDNL
ncbi:MAG: Wzz/FepE/Etk N-terminal domain-containing protein, partial [Bacteroidales bacterium]|nr:Wzz/FepE/Etk N-terminal domain-containing protein [Bacteroidales bacterium]